MAGIYLHIPFCKQACHYCDFHFSTNQKYVNEMTDALCEELKLQKDYLGNEAIATIYFGGGTPSVLNRQQVEKLLNAIKKEFVVEQNTEITLEANPDDLTEEKLQDFYNAGINRLSIGVQSFQEEILQYLNRAHNEQQATRCITDARKIGFNNISIDLIYAIPARDHQNWHQDLTKALSFHPEHISSYCLTIEPKTTFGNWLKKGTFQPIDEDFAATQFEILLERLSTAGYEQYEVSNFCLPEQYSRHNSGYWQQKKYLGVGPSAHSYDGINRRSNISNNPKYIKALQAGIVPYTEDRLDEVDKVNEYLLTTLRTKWGADLERLAQEFNYDVTFQKKYLDQLLREKYIIIENNHLALTKRGMLFADKIASDLFMA